jgi:hypothetical protein
MYMTTRHTASRVDSQYRGAEPLSNAMIQKYAPSVLQTEKHESRSERYAHITTIDVVEAMRKEGFLPFEVVQSRTRIPGKREFAKHMIKFRRQEDLGVYAPEINEVVLVNGHDGSASYRMMAGIFRMVCSNGLIAWEGTDEIRVRHTGNVVDKVIEGSYRVLDQLKLIDENKDEMKSIELDAREQALFAQHALALRYEPNKAPINVNDVLRPMRGADKFNDLWTVFNRTQEHLVRGGQRGFSSVGRRTTTRAITGIDQNVKLNQALWGLAQGMADIKSGREVRFQQAA